MKNKFIILIFVISCITIFSENVKITDYIEMGDEYLKEKKYDEALLVYNKALGMEQKNVDVLYRLGYLNKEIKEYDTAISFFNKIVEIDPEYKDVYKQLADISEERQLLLVGNTEVIKDRQKKKEMQKNIENEKNKKLEYYKKYLETIDYSDPEMIFYVGNVYMKDFLYEKAREIFSKDKTGNYKNLFGVATISRILGDYDTASKTYEKIINKAPDFSEGYLGAGITARLMGDFKKAINYYKKYLSYEKDEEVYYNAATLYILMKDYDNAKNIAEEGVGYFPDSQKIKELIFEIYSKKSE